MPVFRRRPAVTAIASTGSRPALVTRRACAAVLAGAAVACCALAVAASPALAASPSALCAQSALLPPPVRLPSFAPASGFSFYSETPSTNALAHHVLCRVEITTPHSSPAYLYHISWEVFPNHADALADFAAFNPSSVYTSPRVGKPARGFPSPNEVVTGRFAGEPIIVVIFVDGPALVSGYELGGGTLAQTEALSSWAVADIKHLHVTG